MLRAPLRFAFRKLGPRYPRVLLALQLQAAHLVVLGGCALLLLEVEMSFEEFLRIVAVSQALALLDNVLSMRVIFRRVRPADAWLQGERTGETASAAFRALAGLPRDYLREHAITGLLVSTVPVAAFVTWEIDEGWIPAFPLVVAAAGVVLLYGMLVRFLAMELILRPVLEKVSADLPRDFAIGVGTIPLQRRLLLALPAINVISGVIVVAIADPGRGGLAAIGVGVIVAVAVAFTLSFELSLLLARSIAEPLHDLQAGAEAVAAGDLSVRVPVLGTDEAGHLAASFNTMVTGLRERAALHDAMAAFVDHQVTHRVMDQGGHEIAGEEVEVTILFLDIRGFTAFAERATATEVVARLNAFYELVVPLLVARGGHVNSFLGDGLLAVFGAPSRLDDHADRARHRRRPALAGGPAGAGRGGDQHRAGGGRDDRGRRAARVHRDRGRGEHRLAGRGRDAGDGRRHPRHRGDARAAHAGPRRVRPAPAGGPQGQARARRAVRPVEHRGRPARDSEQGHSDERGRSSVTHDGSRASSVLRP
jgi:adenylate cyclase